MLNLELNTEQNQIFELAVNSQKYGLRMIMLVYEDLVYDANIAENSFDEEFKNFEY